MSRQVFIVLINLLISVTGLFVGMYAHEAAKKYFSHDIIYIAPYKNETRLLFDINEIDTLKRRFHNYEFSIESRAGAILKTHTHQAAATVIYTDAAYFSMHFINFTEGRRWQENTDAIMLNEALAWKLFGGGNITGLTVNINDRPYTITGVARQEARGTGEYTAWMPMPQDRAGGQTRQPGLHGVNALYIRANNYNLVDIGVNTNEMLKLLRRNPDGYAIVDINRFIEAIGMRSRLLLSVFWLFTLITALRILISKVLYISSHELNKANLRLGISVIMPILITLTALYALYTGVNAFLYWLPNPAASDSPVLFSIFNIGRLPPEVYLSYGLKRLVWLNRIGNISWAVGVVSFLYGIVAVDFTSRTVPCYNFFQKN